MIRSIVIPKEDKTINLKMPIKKPVYGRVVKLIVPIGDLEGLGITEAPIRNKTLHDE